MIDRTARDPLIAPKFTPPCWPRPCPDRCYPASLRRQVWSGRDGAEAARLRRGDRPAGQKGTGPPRYHGSRPILLHPSPPTASVPDSLEPQASRRNGARSCCALYISCLARASWWNGLRTALRYAAVKRYSVSPDEVAICDPSLLDQSNTSSPWFTVGTMTQNQTPLYHAVVGHHGHIVKLLLSRSADPNIVTATGSVARPKLCTHSWVGCSVVYIQLQRRNARLLHSRVYPLSIGLSCGCVMPFFGGDGSATLPCTTLRGTV